MILKKILNAFGIVKLKLLTLYRKVLFMENNNSAQNDLKEIRKIMERSTRFISLSGLSGVTAGLFALIGAMAAWYQLTHAAPVGKLPYFYSHLSEYSFYILDAIIILILAVGSAVYFSYRKAIKHSTPFWHKTAKKLLISLLTPLVIGGLFCLILLHHGYVGLIPPVMLVFYGLALIQSKQHTLNEIGSLGYLEILLGLANLIWLGKGIYFWAVGFGICHIAYGIYMYFKYDND